jgi:hypothetical protein
MLRGVSGLRPTQHTFRNSVERTPDDGLLYDSGLAYDDK